jgi:hypothetical protein
VGCTRGIGRSWMLSGLNWPAIDGSSTGVCVLPRVEEGVTTTVRQEWNESTLKMFQASPAVCSSAEGICREFHRHPTDV